MEKRQWIMAALLTSLSILFLGLIYSFQGNLKFPDMKKNQAEKTRQYKGKVTVKATFNIASDKRLGLSMVLPCSKPEQRAELKKNMVRIRNDILVSVDQNLMNTWVQNRQYEPIKQVLLQVINKYVEEPINTMYFDQFFYN
jgi:flagellar basal body-associated protein FliL